MKNQNPNLRAVNSSTGDIETASTIAPAVRQFLASISGKTKITSDDQSALGAIEQMVDSLRRTSSTARPSISGEAEAIFAQLDENFTKFYSVTTGSQSLEISGVTVSIPALESQAVRVAVAQLGEAVAEGSEHYVEARRQQINRQAEREASERSALDRAVAIPTLGAAIRCFELASSDSNLGSEAGRAFDLVRDIARAYAGTLGADFNLGSLLKLLSERANSAAA